MEISVRKRHERLLYAFRTSVERLGVEAGHPTYEKMFSRYKVEERAISPGGLSLGEYLQIKAKVDERLVANAGWVTFAGECNHYGTVSPRHAKSIRAQFASAQ